LSNFLQSTSSRTTRSPTGGSSRSSNTTPQPGVSQAPRSQLTRGGGRFQVTWPTREDHAQREHPREVNMERLQPFSTVGELKLELARELGLGDPQHLQVQFWESTNSPGEPGLTMLVMSDNEAIDNATLHEWLRHDVKLLLIPLPPGWVYQHRIRTSGIASASRSRDRREGGHQGSGGHSSRTPRGPRLDDPHATEQGTARGPHLSAEQGGCVGGASLLGGSASVPYQQQ
ncbi:unnamed protein product, partial [Amoebophrya sp. A25]